MKKPLGYALLAVKKRKDGMQTKIICLHAPRRNPRHPVRGYNQQALDTLTLRALAELVVDVMEQRGAIPPRQPWEMKS